MPPSPQVCLLWKSIRLKDTTNLLSLWGSLYGRVEQIIKKRSREVRQLLNTTIDLCIHMDTIWNLFFPKLMFCQVQCSKKIGLFCLPGKLVYCHCIIGCVPIEVVSRRNHLSSNYICQSHTRHSEKGQVAKDRSGSPHAWLCRLQLAPFRSQAAL